MSEVRIVPAGDAALLVELPPGIDPETSARVIALADAVRARCGSALRDVVIGYCTVTLYFDPLVTDATRLEGEVQQLAADLVALPPHAGGSVEVPVCYGGDLGPDLRDVAAFAGASEDDVVRLHAGVTYRVYVVGFIPGFPYMAAVDPRIALPRRSVPRTHVPPGSVAIAAGQTGIYPAETPGGWHIIGRTWIKPYDPSREQPFLFRPGDRVTFRAVSRDEFDRATCRP
jgi:KipI family sensor histidine kinase inhibitor